MRSSRTVARREFRGYFDHPTAYILIIAFLALALFLTFRTLYASGIADLRVFFNLLPWLFAIFIPALTMRSIAEEKGRGTLEWLIAHPLSEGDLLMGKFLGNWLFSLVALAGTLPAAFGLMIVSEAPFGPIVAQYIGTTLLAAQMVAIGLFASSATKNQITAFILAVAASMALVLAGLPLVLVGLPPSLGGVVNQLAVIPHFENVGRGLVDLRDVLYFVTTTALFLSFAYLLLVRERLSPGRGGYRRLRQGIAAAAVAILVLNLLGSRIRGRVDLTEEKLYTLSEGTKDILERLDDIVTIKLFVSRGLPPEIAITLRDLRDMLADYRRFSNGQIRLQELNPNRDSTLVAEAESYGIQEIQFNVLREDEFQVRQGWLGMVVIYADERKSFPIIDRTDDLEYRLTSAIRSMVSPERPRAAFLTGFGARAASQILGINETLSERYDLENVDLSSEEEMPELSPDLYDVVVMVGPMQPLGPAAVSAIRSYLDAGGAGLFLMEGIQIDQRLPFAVPVETGLEGLFEERGLRVARSLAFDLGSNQRISMGQQGLLNIVRSYPPWPLARPSRSHPVTRDLEVLGLGWANALEIVDSTRVVPLWTTTEYGGQRPGGGPIGPEAFNEVDQEGLSVQTLGVAIAPPAEEEGGDGPGESGPGGRLVVVADANLLDEQFVRANPRNLVFVANAMDWLAQDEGLIAIRSKDRAPSPLVFGSDFQKIALRWGNLVGIPVLFVLLGLARGVRRRRESETLWREVSGGGGTDD